MEVEGEQTDGMSKAGAEWPLEGKIEFENVSLCYEPELPPALRNLSFKIEGGSKVTSVSKICIPFLFELVSIFFL